jgi:DNA primase
MISQKTIDDVLDLDIKDVISAYVDLKRAGANWKGKSPFTDERTPSFMVSPIKRIFKCFSSGKGGSLIKFIMEKEHLEYPDAIRFICKKHNVPLIETEQTAEEKAINTDKEAMYILNNAALSYYSQNLNYFQESLNYVYGERGLTGDIINKFQIGFAPNALSGLTNFLINSGYSWQIAVKCSVLGYLPEKNNLYDKFRNRIMFPIKSIGGNVLGFGGRALAVNDKTAKYLNSSDSLIYNKSQILYGIFESKKAIIDKNMCYLSEGYLDVVMFHQKGVENIVASAGTALTIDQVKLIKRLTKNVTIMFDNDSAGIKAALRGTDILLEQGMHVKVILFPEGQDPDSFARRRTTEEIEKYIYDYSQDFLIFMLNYLIHEANGNVNLHAQAIEETLKSISKIPDIVAREIYLKECSRISSIPIDGLRVTLKKFVVEEESINLAIPQNFYEQFLTNRNFIQTECEKKILQYVLAYGNLSLTFKEVFLDIAGSSGLQTIKEVRFDAKRTVLEKVKHELETDNIHFLDMTYSTIYEKAKLIDLNNFNSLEQHLDTETYLLAIELRNDEMLGNKNVFTFGNVLNAPTSGPVPNLSSYLQNAISENLLFYKVIYIEWLIEEESRKLHPNKENVKDYIELIIRIKKELNTI